MSARDLELLGSMIVEWSGTCTCGSPTWQGVPHERHCGAEPVANAAPMLAVLRWAADRSLLLQPPGDDVHLAYDLGLLHLVPDTEWTPPPRRVGQRLTDRIRPDRLEPTEAGRALLAQADERNRS